MYNYAETKRKGYKGKEILKLGTTSALIVFEFFVCFLLPHQKRKKLETKHTHRDTETGTEIKRKRERSHI